MAESEQSTQPPTITSLPANPPHNLVNLISINAAAQLPLKLSPSNYLSWRAQFHTLLVGYDLLGYLDGSLACPLRSVVTNGISTVNPAYTFWLRQDQLLLHAIIASVSESITPFVASSQTSREAWDRLSTLYASRSRTRIMHLKDKLALITRGTQSISEYLQTIKSAADELALAGVPQSNDDLLLYSLRGLGSEYKEIVAAIRARDSPISFEELHDKLLEQEVYLKREASQSEPSHITANATRTYSQPKPSNNRRNEKNHFSQNRGPPHQRNQFFQGSSPHPDPRSNFKRPPPNQHNPNPIVCQYCGKRGHTARTCYQIHPPAPMANHTSIQQSPHSNWLVDSAASHHVTTDLNALSMPQDYAGSDDIVIGDGTGLEITHTGSTTLPTPSTPFTLSNVLCVPSMQNNLISVSKFCKTNKVSVEFFPAFFVVKDLRTGAPRLRGQNKNDVYEWPNTVGLAAPSPIANVSIKAFFRDWHNRLGHPSSKSSCFSNQLSFLTFVIQATLRFSL
jgi:hypothetical protein